MEHRVNNEELICFDPNICQQCIDWDSEFEIISSELWNLFFPKNNNNNINNQNLKLEFNLEKLNSDSLIINFSDNACYIFFWNSFKNNLGKIILKFDNNMNKFIFLDSINKGSFRTFFKQYLSSLDSNNNKIIFYNNTINITCLKKSDLILPPKNQTGTPLGLVNLGTSCYMNAALQSLFNVKKLINYLLEIKHLILNPQSTNFLLKAFVRTILYLSRQAPGSKKMISYSPNLFHNSISQENEFNENCGDSFDVIRHFIQKCHEQLLTIKKENDCVLSKYIINNINYGSNMNISNIDIQALNQTLNNYIMNDRSFLVNIFYYIERSKNKCMNCGYYTSSFGVNFFVSFHLKEIAHWKYQKIKMNFMNYNNNMNNRYNNNNIFNICNNNNNMNNNININNNNINMNNNVNINNMNINNNNMNNNININNNTNDNVNNNFNNINCQNNVNFNKNNSISGGIKNTLNDMSTNVILTKNINNNMNNSNDNNAIKMNNNINKINYNMNNMNNNANNVNLSNNMNNNNTNNGNNITDIIIANNKYNNNSNVNMNNNINPNMNMNNICPYNMNNNINAMNCNNVFNNNIQINNNMMMNNHINIIQNIQEPDTVTLEEAFEYYKKETEMEGYNICQNCKTNSKFALLNSFYSAPDILIIQLDRGEGNKFDIIITYPEFIDLNNEVESRIDNNKYRLICNITHRGGHGVNGHYVAYCFLEDKNKWFLFNDSSVTESNFNEVIQDVPDGRTYLLFYKRIQDN